MANGPPRLRFAPSPTGPLHIGGLRTALYNFLFARQHKGTLVLRIEDTDQTRYVAGSEAYIQETLHWCGLLPDEGPMQGGAKGPYRQSERKALYEKHVQWLIAKGAAYYAFDTAEELTAMREALKASGDAQQHYNMHTRRRMCNSLTLSDKETKARIAAQEPYVVRLHVSDSTSIDVQDEIRGNIQVHPATLEDKVLLKADGMPTYHLANVVDDHTMDITHVIRGEEWLPSLAYHVLLYEAFGWKKPLFAHLPLILNPHTKGKLSKRNALKHGYPIFPIRWMEDTQSIDGFKERGFLAEATLNYLALLGWTHPEQKEILRLDEMVQAFSLTDISPAGAKYDLSKAKWVNAQHLRQCAPKVVASQLKTLYAKECAPYAEEQLVGACALVQPRADTLLDLQQQIQSLLDWDESEAKQIKANIDAPTGAKLMEWATDALADDITQFKSIWPALRYALTGKRQGPDLRQIIALLGPEECKARIQKVFS